MAKIGIITFHAAFNYGSMLQTYAMQTYLTKLGHEVEIVNFRTPAQKLGYARPVDFTTYKTIKQSIKRVLLFPSSITQLNKKWELFNSFLNEELFLTNEYDDLTSLKGQDWNYDYLITGSDQIWNINAFDFSEAYFGSFVSNKTKLIAYAPSIGPEPETQEISMFSKYLDRYSAISVREHRTKDFLSKVRSDISLVLDPTFLLESSDYDKILDSKPIIDGDYIFYYTPGGARHEFLKEAELIGKKMNLPVICDNCYNKGDLDRYSNIKSYSAVGPKEFLNLIKNAKLVCGASFHLIAFAIIFKKEFYCMNGDIDSRFQNLLQLFDLQSRCWSIKRKNDFNPSEINYSAVNDLLNSLRKISLNFLKDALEVK